MEKDSEKTEKCPAPFMKGTIPALLIALGLMLLGIFIKNGIASISNNERVVTVRGLSELEVKANRVTWPIVSKSVGNDIVSLYDEIQKTNNAIVNFLKSHGIQDNEIMVNAPQVNDMQANSYGDRNVKYRYNVTTVIVVTSSQVEKVQKLIEKQTDLMRQGIAIVADDYRYNTTYEFSDLNKIKPDMVADATQNARAAAEKFAMDSRSTLGKIKSASQGQFSIEDRDQYTPYIKNVRVVTTIVYYLKD